MPIVLDITFDGLPLIHDMQEFQLRLAGIDEALKEVGRLWSEQMALNWASASWPPLAASTLRRKGGSLPRLYRTGELYRSATEGEWQEEGKGTVALGLPSYGLFHLTGTRFMPVRDFGAVGNVPEAGGELIGRFLTEGLA